jgi:homoserine O-acetyltransferase/O-succinyltransferase
MINNSYYSQDVHGPYELHDIGNLELEEGGTIRGCQLAYATFGALDAAKDNAILIPTWYSGTNKVMEQVTSVRANRGRNRRNRRLARLWAMSGAVSI